MRKKKEEDGRKRITLPVKLIEAGGWMEELVILE